MAQETEAKFYLQHPDELCKRAEKLGAEVVESHVHEVNLRFDTPDRDFRRAGRVLRLRQDKKVRLTYKDTDSMQAGALSRREIEITVGDFDTTRELLEALGYELAFIYEKYRSTYKFEGVELMLDELPYGHFVEIEGEGNSLKATAEKLGLRWDTVIPESYSRLFERLQASRKLDFRDLTFENIRGFQVAAADLGVKPADG